MDLVPGNSLITSTPKKGRALALTLARHTIHALQPDEAVLKGGRPQYSTDPAALIAASHVVALKFATIAAANHYWRPRTVRALRAGCAIARPAATPAATTAAPSLASAAKRTSAPASHSPGWLRRATRSSP